MTRLSYFSNLFSMLGLSHHAYAYRMLLSMTRNMLVFVFLDKGNYFTAYHLWTLTMCPGIFIKILSLHALLDKSHEPRSFLLMANLLEKCRTTKIQPHQEESRTALFIPFCFIPDYWLPPIGKIKTDLAFM